MRRGSRERCWCGADLAEFDLHASYATCISCGSYVNRRPVEAESLPAVYGLDSYWVSRQSDGGHPTIEGRGDLYRRDGRLDKWLELVEGFGPKTGSVVEVGCAPGIMLDELSRRGYECLGVEISESVAEWLRSRFSFEVRAGFFPGIELPQVDLFLAFDVLEHSPDPVAFLSEAARLLKPGAMAIIQTPIDRYEYSPPFGPQFANIFDDVEHTFLFTDGAIELLAARAGMELVSIEHRTMLAGEIAVRRRPVPPNASAVPTAAGAAGVTDSV